MTESENKRMEIVRAHQWWVPAVIDSDLVGYELLVRKHYGRELEIYKDPDLWQPGNFSLLMDSYIGKLAKKRTVQQVFFERIRGRDMVRSEPLTFNVESSGDTTGNTMALIVVLLLVAQIVLAIIKGFQNGN